MRPEVPSSCGRFCGRCIFYGVLGHFCSKGSLFTGFWLAWVRKARFFTHQMASHIDAPRSAVELRSILRSMHYLRRFGSLLLQRLAIYRLVASSSCGRCIIYAFWANSAPKARYLQAFGQLMLRSMHYLRRFGSLLLQRLAIYRLLASLGKESSVFYSPDGLSY